MCNAAEKHLPGIRAAHAAGDFVAVESERVVRAELLAPERLFEVRLEAVCLAVERVGPSATSKPPRAFRGEAFGEIDVALDLAERDPPLGQSSVGMEYCVLQLLPALVTKPLSDGVDIPQTGLVGIARTVDPAKGAFDGRR